MNSLRRELQELQNRSSRVSKDGAVDKGDNADSNWKLQQLQIQYDHLQARAVSQDQKYQDSEHRVEVCPK